MNKLRISVLGRVKKYTESLSDSEQGKIETNMRFMADGNLEVVATKQLRGAVRELIVGNHRIIYFINNKTIYFVDGFRKKSQKIPINKIKEAIKMYKIIKS